MAARSVGAEPSSPCAQLEHLADLLRNTVNSQQSPTLYEVCRSKIAEDIEKQTVMSLCWAGKVPGICAGTLGHCGPWSTACHRILGVELEHQLPPLPEQGGQPGNRRDLDA